MAVRPSRRTFLKAAGAGLAGPFIFPRLSMAQSANGMLQHASIGVGGMGKSDLDALRSQKNIEIVAICDVDENNLKAAAELAPNARQYRDWRELLETEGDKIDSVNVATPDSMHAPITMSALNKGKHVYCQKPLTHDVYEARQIAQAAKKAGVVTQMGNQIHSHEAYRMAWRLVRDGAIGKIKEWHSWCGAPACPQGLPRPEGADPVPATLDWDKWIGVAPERPFKADVYHPFKWRSWKDFGCGAIGDFLCHIYDPVFMGIQPGPVLSLSVEVDGVYEECWPKWEIVHYEMAGSPMTAGATIKATWADGGKQPDFSVVKLPDGYKIPGTGSLLLGEDGAMLIPHWSDPLLLPEDKFKDFKRPDIGPRQDHYRTFVNACLGDGETTSHFGYAGPLTEVAQLGNIGNQFPGVTLAWDAEKMAFTNNDAANALLKRTYREGWHVEGLS